MRKFLREGWRRPRRSSKESSLQEQDAIASTTENPHTAANFKEDPIISEYQYQSLSKKGDIRVFRFQTNHPNSDYAICGELETINLKNPQHLPYTALSYTWGSPFAQVPPWDHMVWSSHQILCDGQSLVVQGNLYDALLALHQKHPKDAYWIDALCIHQADEIERNEQVRIMGDVYAEAAKTIIWLGMEDDASVIAFPLINEFACSAKGKDSEIFSRFQRPFNDPELFSILKRKPFGEDEWQAISDLFTRTWFQRLWISQEYALSQSLNFMCGLVSLPSYRFALFAVHMRRLNWLLGGAFQRRRDRSIHNTQGINLLNNVVSLRSFAHHSKDLYTNWHSNDAMPALFAASTKSQMNAALLGALILHGSSRFCTDKRDKVFAPLAIAARVVDLSDDFQSFPVPDYGKTLQTICIDTSKYFLTSSSGVGFLSLVERYERPAISIPTWAVDFGTLNRDSLLADDKRHNATKSWLSGGKSIEGNLLKVFGIKFDNIIRTSDSRSIDMTAILGICAELESQNNLKHGFIEAFFEILAHSLPSDNTLQNPDILSAIRHYVLFCLIKNSVSRSTHSDMQYEFLDANANRFLPSSSHVRSLCEKYVELHAKPHGAEWDAIITAPMVLVRAHFDTMLARRTILQTLYGNLALGPGATRPGDEVWFVRGGRVPYILRPVENGNYELVGESFLHGFMQGEIFGVGEKSIDDAVEISIQ